MRFLIPRLSDLTETQYRLFLLTQAIVVRHAAAALPAPDDADVADAVSSVAATLETAGKGIIYEHRAASVPAQRIAGALSSGIADLVKRVGAEGARLERDAARALRALERTARDARQEVPDAARPEASWLTLAARIMAAAESGPSSAAQNPEPEEAGPKLVI